MFGIDDSVCCEMGCFQYLAYGCLDTARICCLTVIYLANNWEIHHNRIK